MASSVKPGGLYWAGWATTAWGGCWGSDAQVESRPSDYHGSGSAWRADDDLIRQVLDKWDVVGRSRGVDQETQEPWQDAFMASEEAPAPAPIGEKVPQTDGFDPAIDVFLGRPAFVFPKKPGDLPAPLPKINQGNERLAARNRAAIELFMLAM